ncbi:serine/threonine protein kinase [Planctomycetota bacterium]|nr:serine/threonine protein kinase [Planctomycetota bacterium]
MIGSTLGDLARRARLIDEQQLDDALRMQQQLYQRGDFRRLGQILVLQRALERGDVRKLLARQGISVMGCPLCHTRYNVCQSDDQDECVRCGRRLVRTRHDDPLTIEDVLSSGTVDGDKLYQIYRQRSTRLGTYEVMGEVGRGGMGVIYKGYETNLRRDVALKFLRPAGEEVTAEDMERFRREARAAAALRHDNVVQVYSIGFHGGLAYMTMDFVEGVPLNLLVEAGVLDHRRVVKVGIQIAKALHYVHGQGILHRDVKPANVVVEQSGKPVLVDFGIAKSKAETTSVTQDDEVLGSLTYMAPEYLLGGILDARADVYGLGIVLYECLTDGFFPYGQDVDDYSLAMKIAKEQPREVRDANPEISQALGAIVMKAIAKDPAKRFQTAAELAEALARSLDGAAPSNRYPELHDSHRTKGGGGTLSSPAPPLAEEVAAARADQRLVPVLIALLGLAILGGGGLWFIARTRANNAEREATGWRQRAGEAEQRAGEALEAAGRPAQAEAAYGKAAELLPTDSAPLEARARLRAARGDQAGAEEDWSAAEALRGR